MSENLFISDLHLSVQRPKITTLFLRFLKQRASQAEHLYILGDLFDAWIGDDDIEEPIQEVVNGLSLLSQQGVAISFLAGNRDFLLGQGFADRCNLNLMGEKTVINCYGQSILILHGDQLCTDDIQYQQARLQLRNPKLITDFLSKPLVERRAIAKQYRQMSGEKTSLLAADIMDVNQQTVLKELQDFSVNSMIHGHTHRQHIHKINELSSDAKRVVLGDWSETEGSVYSISAEKKGFELVH